MPKENNADGYLEYPPDPQALSLMRQTRDVTFSDFGDVKPLLSGEASWPELNVVCPYCRGDYTHIVGAGTRVGTDEHEAVEAYFGAPPTGTTAERRSAIEIVMTCEACGDRTFSLVIQQHKGINYLRFLLRDDD